MTRCINREVADERKERTEQYQVAAKRQAENRQEYEEKKNVDG